MRGEYATRLKTCLALGELPPRARRIPVVDVGKAFWNGTTSACAENTHGHGHIRIYRGNYLRVRGEYWTVDDLLFYGWELPPRARRIHTVAAIAEKQGGTTSACAENTSCCGWLGESRRNYLRVRGEYMPS